MKFSLQTILAFMVVAALIAAIYSERQKTVELTESIASTKEWLALFNHHSIEALPYFEKALAWEDPALPFSEKLVAQVEEQRKRIQSMPDRHESDVSALEVATMNPFCYTYAIHVPEHKNAKVDFFIAKKSNDSLEDHFEDKDTPFKKPWSIDMPTGLSKLEVIQTATVTTPPPPKPGMIAFTKSTPTIEVRLNGKSVFKKSMPGYSNVGSNNGWKPDGKKLLVLNTENTFHEFPSFYFTEIPDGPMTGGFTLPGKSFTIKFRLSAKNSIQNRGIDE